MNTLMQQHHIRRQPVNSVPAPVMPSIIESREETSASCKGGDFIDL